MGPVIFVATSALYESDGLMDGRCNWNIRATQTTILTSGDAAHNLTSRITTDGRSKWKVQCAAWNRHNLLWAPDPIF